MQRLLTLLLITQMLITSVCAYAHMSADFDEPFSSPHIHIDTGSHADHHWSDHAESPESHDLHEHEHDDGDESCHVHLNLAGLSSFSFTPLHLHGAKATPFNHHFSGLTLTPPVPPPTH